MKGHRSRRKYQKKIRRREKEWRGLAKRYGFASGYNDELDELQKFDIPRINLDAFPVSGIIKSEYLAGRIAARVELEGIDNFVEVVYMNKSRAHLSVKILKQLLPSGGLHSWLLKYNYPYLRTAGLTEIISALEKVGIIVIETITHTSDKIKDYNFQVGRKGIFYKIAPEWLKSVEELLTESEEKPEIPKPQPILSAILHPDTRIYKQLRKAGGLSFEQLLELNLDLTPQGLQAVLEILIEEGNLQEIKVGEKRSYIATQQ